jgi:hypothetical protein
MLAKAPQRWADQSTMFARPLFLFYELLTYRYAGRDFRLTDVAGRFVKGIVA